MGVTNCDYLSAAYGAGLIRLVGTWKVTSARMYCGFWSFIYGRKCHWGYCRVGGEEKCVGNVAVFPIPVSFPVSSTEICTVTSVPAGAACRPVGNWVPRYSLPVGEFPRPSRFPIQIPNKGRFADDPVGTGGKIRRTRSEIRPRTR